MRPTLSYMAIAVCWYAVGACAALAADAESIASTRERIERLLVDLDSAEFSTRTRAFEQLQELSAHDASRKLLAELVERALVGAEISFEVRKQLERLRRDLPPAELSPSLEIDADAIDGLLTQLADDSYARRLGAESRLRWLLDSADAVGLIYERVKHAAANVRPAHEQTRSLERIYERSRAAWLEDETRNEDPGAQKEQIEHLVEQLADSNLEEMFRLTGEPAAVVELRDLLASDANIAPIRDALEARVAAGVDSLEAQKRLTELLNLTKPAMIAEYWIGGRHLNIQRLLIGVPSVVEGRGTSHFDRIDDRTAHCVAGVNLSEGDYPVGVAVPHPIQRTAFFHLINQPTPRRRMAYEYRVKEAEAVRHAALVTRTFERYLARRLPIDERELTLIMQFDPSKVSRFAGRYLTSVDDRRIALRGTAGVAPPTETPIPTDGPSIHGLLCSWLASKGTQDAVPELLKAIEENCVAAPSETVPCRFDRFAALAIAQRDPWPDVDRWLGKVLTRQETLIHGQTEGPELGATAASILLRRHDRSPDDFGLIPSGEVFARRYGLEAYRWKTPDAEQDVANWWEKRQENGE